MESIRHICSFAVVFTVGMVKQASGRDWKRQTSRMAIINKDDQITWVGRQIDGEKVVGW